MKTRFAMFLLYTAALSIVLFGGCHAQEQEQEAELHRQAPPPPLRRIRKSQQQQQQLNRRRSLISPSLIEIPSLNEQQQHLNDEEDVTLFRGLLEEMMSLSMSMSMTEFSNGFTLQYLTTEFPSNQTVQDAADGLATVYNQLVADEDNDRSMERVIVVSFEYVGGGTSEDDDRRRKLQSRRLRFNANLISIGRCSGCPSITRFTFQTNRRRRRRQLFEDDVLPTTDELAQAYRTFFQQGNVPGFVDIENLEEDIVETEAPTEAPLG